MMPQPSEVLRDLDLSSSDAELLERKAALHAKGFSALSDAEHLEVAAIASELERRRVVASSRPA
jgi:hypothetical protein